MFPLSKLCVGITSITLFAGHHFTRCCSPQRWSVLMYMACCYGNRDTAPVQCSLCGDVPEINPLVNQWSILDLEVDNKPPTVPGGQRHPGKQARLTQGKSRFWHVLAHSRPFSPVSHSTRINGGEHWADRRSTTNERKQINIFKIFLWRSMQIHSV